jgi:hypothetical protein
MRKYLAFMVMVCIAAVGVADSDESAIIKIAEADAREDGRTYCNSGWGIVAFLASFGATPLAGGFLTLVALGVGESDVPASRLEEIQGLWDDPEATATYESHYRQTLTRIQHLKNAGSALAGTALCVGIIGIVITILFGGMAG